MAVFVRVLLSYEITSYDYGVFFFRVLLSFFVLQAELRAKGWELRRQEGDGNCLFRAISQHIYGDPGMHGDIRRQCLDFMRKVHKNC